MAASSGEHIADGGGVGYANEDESACSTPFVSAPSSPARDRDTTSFSAAFASVPVPFGPARDPSFSAAGWFRSAPASPGRGGGGHGCTAEEYGRELGLGLDFDFDLSRCPSPAVAAMCSADELFDNGHIRPMRLPSFLLRPQALPPLLDGDVQPPQPRPSEPVAPPAAAAAGADDERGRVRSRSSRRRYRSLSPFRARWLSPPPAPAAKSVEPAAAGEASRSSSTSSTASSASSSSRSYRNRRWGFLKDILHRSKSSDGGGGGEHPPPPSAPPKQRSSSPSPATRGRGRARRSAHARLYESRRTEAEEMRRRTFLPYRQGLPLLGCLGLGSRGYVAMHGLAVAGKARP